MKIRIIAIMLLLVGGLIGYFNYNSQINSESKFPFKLGLDLAGGTQLVYQADISNLDAGSVNDSMDALRDVIERRTNMFGVSEPLVQIENAGDARRLIVELPGVTDINQAVTLIGQTPLLEFKVEKPNTAEIISAQREMYEKTQNGEDTSDIDPLALEDPYQSTTLTGRYLEKSQLIFDPNTGEPIVLLAFNAEGKDLFAQITKENLNKVVAIYLDGQPITTPVVRSEIRDGKAEISGGFTLEEAKELVKNLNYGALPVPIELVSTQNIGASLGENVLNKGVNAGIYGLIAIVVFMFFWYRLPGLLSVLSLTFYVVIMLALFKVIPVTLTSAGIAGFIMSIGMAVDANVLVFERIKEELRNGRDIESAIKEGFARAWLSIRDSNISSIITAIILFWLGTSSVQGFALTFGIGVMISMFTALTVTRTFLLAVAPKGNGKVAQFLFGCGVTKN
ncbi:MAG: protein-export membrane protein SecD, preprotein translocase subunit SecD [Candidatus Campbellbacteria bacterium GW2011_OD1_34_28]|nr:MAG: protein-export membrane protein SecD, preprotein translocase subunit SecD [Candidatus Campbellbacteria bacterium GW2011_OD1_34_28]HAQ01533.1 protein translocase subunit SecD [Candidatus Campbellbacteria bacterium]